jgi:hypothetical protein
MPAQSKRKADGRKTLVRIVSLVLAVLLLGSVLLAALLTNIY